MSKDPGLPDPAERLSPPGATMDASLSRRGVVAGLGAAMIGADAPAPARDVAGVADGMLSSGYIARRGRHVRRAAAGLALTPQGVRRFDADRPFRVASVSKMITAHALLRLAGSGALDLDADVSAMLGWRLRHPAHPETPITLRMLLSHTSGVRNGAEFPIPFNVSLRARLEKATATDHGGWFSPAQEPPGRWFAYSDANFPLAAEIAERATGVRFDRLVRDTVFGPARLDIGYNWSGVSARRRHRAAAGARWLNGAWTAQVDAAPPPAPEVMLYRARGDTLSTIADVHLGENGFAFAPHGGLRLSLNDMDALARRLMASPSTPLQARAHWTFTPGSPNGETEKGFFHAYGLGMHAPTGGDGDRYFGAQSADWRGHFGDAYGWMTGLWWNAKENATLVWAINGMPETERVQSTRSALTAAEQNLIDAALGDVGLG